MFLSIPCERIKKVKRDIKRTLNLGRISARGLARITGQLISMSKAVLPAKLSVSQESFLVGHPPVGYSFYCRSRVVAPIPLLMERSDIQKNCKGSSASDLRRLQDVVRRRNPQQESGSSRFLEFFDGREKLQLSRTVSCSNDIKKVFFHF